jgi:hypothetical protein
MKNISLLIAFFILSFTGCESKKIDGIYASNEGPYFKFTKGKIFEFGIPGDTSPLKGNFTLENDRLNLIANSIMLENYATTNFICHIANDTLFIDVLEIVHPKFEIYIDKNLNFARTRKDTIVNEFKLSSPEAEEELFIYYKLVHDKFIKRKGD